MEEKEAEPPNQTFYRGKNDWRSDLLSKSRVSPYLLKSLQPCTVPQNVNVLLDVKVSLKSVPESNKINGLLAVLEHLLLMKIDESGNEIPNNFLLFDDALELFLSYDTDNVSDTKNINDRQRFKHALLHPKYGLCVYIFNPVGTVGGGYIILRSDDVDLSSFLNELSSDINKKKTNQKAFVLTKEIVQMLLNSMDTEWDKKVARVFLGALHSLAELEELGITSETTAGLATKVLEIAKECQNAKSAAKDIIALSIKEKLQSFKADVANKQALLKIKKTDWPADKIHEMEEEIEKIQCHIKENTDLLECPSKQQQQGLDRRCKRKADQLVEMQRLKSRKLGKQGKYPTWLPVTSLANHQYFHLML